MAKRKRMTKKRKNKRQKGLVELHVESEAQYVVEEILDWGLHDDGRLMYFLKWENYDDSENSWEFESQVEDCADLIHTFRVNTVNGRQPVKYSFEEYHKFIEYLKIIRDDKYEDLAVIRKLVSKEYSPAELRTNKTIEEIKAKINLGLNTLLEKTFKSKSNSERLESRLLSSKVSKMLSIDKHFGSITEFFDFIDRRKHLPKKLHKWLKTQNKIIAEGKEGLPISVANDVDLETPQLEGYITEYILDTDLKDKDLKIEANEKPMISCECDDCYKCRDECCTAVIGFPYVYNNKGLLSFSRLNTIVFECNSDCKCADNCSNRVIQKGRQVSLQIFRTESLVRGWGVRALHRIEKGSFISKYTGEVLSLTAAEQRPTTYLFDLSAHLDSSDVEFTYVVDASKFGNITRFVNHSCDPNCRVLFAWIKNFDKLLPVIALFAIKTIRPFEELTYDYSMELIDYDFEYETNDTNDSSNESDSEGSDFSEVTPFGAQMRASADGQKEYMSSDQCNESELEDNNNKIKSNNTDSKVERHRKVTFKKIECKCGAKNCRGFLYS